MVVLPVDRDRSSDQLGFTLNRMLDTISKLLSVQSPEVEPIYPQARNRVHHIKSGSSFASSSFVL